MDYKKRKVRFRLEPLDPREVPAQLGQAVELPYAAAPEAQIALTAPHDLGKGVEAGLKIDGLSLNFSKIEFARLKIDSAGSADLKLDPNQVGGPSDPATAAKVQFQDIHFTSQIKFEDILVSGKVAVQDLNFVMKVNKSSPG